MGYYLPQHLSFCECGGRMVVLDIARDRYFHLSAPVETAMRALSAGSPAPPGTIDRLLGRGLIVTDPADGRSMAPVAATAPSHSAVETAATAPAIAWRAAPEVAWRLAQARHALRTQSLAAIFDHVARKKAVLQRGRPPSDQGALTRLAVRFHGAQRLTPLTPVCLPDSLALLAFLFGRGATADLVIAVSGPPFQAHCWVQSQDLLLNSPLDLAVSFTPIRIV